MDLKSYYQKIKETQSKITDPYTVVVSLDTGDGGKAGTPVEVSRALAAKMIVEGTARATSAAEREAFYGRQPAEPKPAEPAKK